MITDAELIEWNERTAHDRPDAEAIADPLWRLAWLYTCKDGAKWVPFVPTIEQVEVIICIHMRGWRRLIIPKARQLGMSTVLALIGLDFCLFCAGFKVALVDKTASDAGTKLDEKVDMVWKNLPPSLRSRFDLPRGYAPNAMAWRITGSKDESEDQLSIFEAGAGMRGGTVQLLWLSEWGWIQANDASRSREILTGSLPAAETGIIVVETTWEGGKTGDMWPLVDEALTTPERLKGSNSWRVLFFGWNTRAVYSQEHGYVDLDSGDYLAEKEKELGITFTQGQKNWYAEKRRTMGVKVKTEFPTVVEECWSAPVSGACYAEEINRLRARKMVTTGEWERGELVHTFWDLGAPANMAVWYVQFVGREIHVIDYEEGLDVTTTQRVAHMLGKPYGYGKHFLPHDAAATQKGGLSFAAELRAAGLHNIAIVPRTVKVSLGIMRVQELLPRCWFRVPNCNEGLASLEAYHWKTDAVGNVLGDEPVHDWSSHSADAFRTMAEAEANGMIKIGGSGSFSDTRIAKQVRKSCRFEMA